MNEGQNWAIIALYFVTIYGFVLIAFFAWVRTFRLRTRLDIQDANVRDLQRQLERLERQVNRAVHR